MVGGGVAGLAAAEMLKEAGLEPIVLEADEAPGGKIRTQHVDGFVVETGPHGFLDKEPRMSALVKRLGLESRLVRANDRADTRWIVRAGKLRALPTSPPAFIASDVLPLGAKLRVLLEPLIAQRTDPSDESVFDFAARRIGSGAADVLVDAMVTGIYGGDPRALSLPAAFPRMRELETKYGGLIRAQLALAKEKKALLGGAEAKKSSAGAPAGTLHSFDEGLGVFIKALASRVPIRLGARVEALERDGAGYRVKLGGAEWLECRAVVLATPADEMARLLRAQSPDATTKLDEIAYASVAVVVHGFAAETFGRSLDGFGFLAPNRENRAILGSIFASTVFPAHAPSGMVMIRTLLGGARHPEHARGTGDELSARAISELSGLLGFGKLPAPTFTRVFRWDRAIPQYNLGHLERVAAADSIERALPGLVLGGNALRGVAMIQCVADAERARERVLGAIGNAGSNA